MKTLSLALLLIAGIFTGSAFATLEKPNIEEPELRYLALFDQDGNFESCAPHGNDCWPGMEL